jgi:hypothetical protein
LGYWFSYQKILEPAAEIIKLNIKIFLDCAEIILYPINMKQLIVTHADSISLEQFVTENNATKIVCANVNRGSSIYDNLFVLNFWETEYKSGWVFQSINSFGLNGFYPTRKEAIEAALMGYPNSEFFVFDTYLEFIKWFNVESGCAR